VKIELDDKRINDIGIENYHPVMEFCVVHLLANHLV
jgi:hypothetical protein